MRRKIAIQRNNLDYQLGDHPQDLEYPDPISDTIPNQTLPLNKLIEKFIRGQAVPIREDAYFLGDLPDPNSMDKIDREMLKRNVAEQIREAQETIKLAQEEQRLNEKNKQQAEIERLKGELQNTQLTNQNPPPGGL